MVVTMDGQRVGMVVDGVREVLRIDSRRIAPSPPMVRGLAAKYILGVLTLEERTVVLLQAGRLFNSEERLQLEGAQVPRQPPPAQVRGMPVVHIGPPEYAAPHPMSP
jgi:purine-binding chemotaxis protein CheW